MNLLLPYFILIIILLQLILRKNSKKTKESNDAFWKREASANNVRRKDISKLDYIVIPDVLPYVTCDNAEINRLQDRLISMKDKKILNLTGYSNTDLKIEYGVANLVKLSEYDDNFVKLAQTITALGKALMNAGYVSEAAAFLEFGIQCATDVTDNYIMLAKYYTDANQPEKIDELIIAASSLKSLSKDVIIKKLEALR